MPTKEELINSFQDTLKVIYSNSRLLASTKNAMKETKAVICNIDKIFPINKQAVNINVVQSTTLDCAKTYVRQGESVAVLNFASAVNPGGGVAVGAMAQEECICRSSNLLPCLKQKHLMKDYYMQHRIANDPMYSDRIIYTPNVTVFKSDDAVPKMLPSSEWFNVDVITCAAPNLRNAENIDKNKLFEILYNRIDKILGFANSCSIKTIILGAWGCGAFKNPPEMVADAFKQVIESKYKHAFNNIVFAIKGKDNNFKVFKSVFGFADDEDSLQNEPDSRFELWQKNNKYYGKSFSILGDSISTLEGYIPKGYKVFFEGDVCNASGVNFPEDTWWGKVINFFGGKLLANSSYSGSRITSKDKSFPSGYSDKRMEDLSKDGISPDVIIIYMGFNDWANGVELEQDDSCCQILHSSFHFRDAYGALVSELKNQYSNAEIICCTLNPTFMSKRESFHFPFERAGIHIEAYNNLIRQAAQGEKCSLVDLYSYNISNDTIDGSHPNVVGMSTLASLICYSLSDDNGKQFIDLKNGKLPVQNNKLNIVLKKENSVKVKFCYKCGAKLEIDDNFCMHCGAKVLELQNKAVESNNDLFDSDIKNIQNDEDFIEIIDNRYKLIRQTGKGASAIVYLAQDIKLNRVCAVKIVKKNTYTNKIAAQESLDEVNKMKLLAHISIPQLYDIYDDEERLCIVMEFIEGKNLSDVISERVEPLAESEVVGWAIQLCKVLFYLHTMKPPKIFRDLKPSNIILQPNGIIKLIDFGTMKNYDESCTEDTVNLGTKGYAAPEQFGGRGQTDARTDIYGLGMTIYHLITGVNPTKPPFEIKPIKTYRSDISFEFERIILKCIEIERKNRYQSATELLSDLEKLV